MVGLILFIILLAVVGVVIYYKKTKSQEIKEWLWMGFGKDPFKEH